MKVVNYGLNLHKVHKDGITVCPYCGCAFQIENEARETRLVENRITVKCPNYTCGFNVIVRYVTAATVTIAQTPERIEKLAENEIFVFGSNMNGEHLGGAALMAVEKFGAIMGKAEGIQGQSYAVPTLDRQFKKLSLLELEDNIARMLTYAHDHPDKTFLVTKLGCGIAGYEVEKVRRIFKKYFIPQNVALPVEFAV